MDSIRITFTFLVVISCLVNGLFVSVICKKRHVLPTAAMIVASLSVNGIIASTISLWLLFSNTSHDTINFGIIFVFASTMLSSVDHLFMAAFERYVAIVYPMRHGNLFTKKRIWLMLGATYYCVFDYIHIWSWKRNTHAHYRERILPVSLYFFRNDIVVRFCRFRLLYAYIHCHAESSPKDSQFVRWPSRDQFSTYHNFVRDGWIFLPFMDDICDPRVAVM